MKKTTLMVLSMVAMLTGCHAYYTEIPADLTVQRVIEVPNSDKGKLFDTSRMWYASSFKPENPVIRYENRENGTIMGDGLVINTTMLDEHRLKFSLSTEVKDNKVRITAVGAGGFIQGTDNEMVQHRMWDHFKAQMDDMIFGFAEYISEPAIGQKTNVW
jgi:hypothetical protein